MLQKNYDKCLFSIIIIQAVGAWKLLKAKFIEVSINWTQFLEKNGSIMLPLQFQLRVQQRAEDTQWYVKTANDASTTRVQKNLFFFLKKSPTHSFLGFIGFWALLGFSIFFWTSSWVAYWSI